MSQKRLYISADIEGTAGVVSGDQCMPGQFEYEKAREWMTAEVIAACEAAFNSGIDEVVVSDSHGNGQNLLLDKMPDNVQVVRSWPRPLCMMEGIDLGNYVGAMLIGYHSGASDMRGVLAHTLHGGAIAEVRLNGNVASETVISAATAAHFGVPLLMVSGDDAYIEHAQSVLPGVEGVVTKWAHSWTSARMLLPRDVQRQIGTSTTSVLARLDEFNAVPLPDTITVDMRLLSRKGAELLDFLPMIERTDSHSIRFVGKDMVEVSKVLGFLLASGAITPK
jgi:D-amino peptidase